MGIYLSMKARGRRITYTSKKNGFRLNKIRTDNIKTRKV